MDQAQQLRNIIKAGNTTYNRPLARIITVTSGKGGVGKSNTAINLAIQFRKEGKRVIILDADFGLANIEIMFGAVPKHNLSDLIYQGKSMKEIITWGPMEVGFISGGSGIAGLSNLGREHLNCIIKNLSELDTIADVVIIQMQDLMKLGNEARMNAPSTVGRNWRWRIGTDRLSEERRAWIRTLASVYHR